MLVRSEHETETPGRGPGDAEPGEPSGVRIEDVLDDLIVLLEHYRRNGGVGARPEEGQLAEGRRGNIEAIISAMPDWAGKEHPFSGCVEALRRVEGIRDPERLCGWLKARAVEKGVYSASVYKRKAESPQAPVRRLADLAGKVLRNVALIGAGQPRIKGIPRDFEVNRSADGRTVVRFPVAVAGARDPITGFELTQDDIRELASNFERARRLGIDVGVKLDHPDVGPRIGDVVGVEVRGNALWVEAVAVPPDALPSNAVSIEQALRGSYPSKSIEYWQLSEGGVLAGTITVVMPPHVMPSHHDSSREEKPQMANEKDVAQAQAADAAADAVRLAEEYRRRVEELEAQVRRQAEAFNALRVERLRDQVAAWRAQRIAQGRWMPVFDELHISDLFCDADVAVDRLSESDAGLVRRFREAVERLMDVVLDARRLAEGRRTTTPAEITPSVQTLQERLNAHWAQLRQTRPDVTYGEAVSDYFSHNPHAYEEYINMMREGRP